MDEIDPADLARLRSRRAWSGDAGATRCVDGRHVVVVTDEVPRCERCGETLSPDALRKAGYRPVKP